MTPEQLLEVLRQYHEYTALTGWRLVLQWLSASAPIIALLSIIVVYLNVNRTQRKNKQNDIEKFKRDLGLKSADEMIEAITNVKVSYHNILGIKPIWQIFLESRVNLDSIKAHIANSISGQHDSTLMIAVQFKKREIVLKEFDEQIEFVYEMGTQMGFDLSELEGFLTDKVGYTDQDIGKVIDRIDNNAKQMIIHLNTLLRDVQNRFLGEIYGERL